MKPMNFFRCLYLAACLIISNNHAKADGGIYPLPLLHSSGFKNSGINVHFEDIYSEKNISLSKSIVRLGGCSGFFVSEEGLVMTNFHCISSPLRSILGSKTAYDAGFNPAEADSGLLVYGLDAHILHHYRDVTSLVKKFTNFSAEDFYLGPNEQAELIAALQQNGKGYVIEVQEVVPKQQYIAYFYKRLPVVKIVYAPPPAIGDFGGARDNWEWPRHAIDFAFLRLYDTTGGKFIPYRPEKVLKLDTSGISEGDEVFLLGYHGRTYRNYPPQYEQMQQQYLLPVMQEVYQWKAQWYEAQVAQEPSLESAYWYKIKKFNNLEKNFRGKMAALEKTSQSRGPVQALTAEQLKKLEGYYYELIPFMMWYKEWVEEPGMAAIVRAMLNEDAIEVQDIQVRRNAEWDSVYTSAMLQIALKHSQKLRLDSATIAIMEKVLASDDMFPAALLHPKKTSQTPAADPQLMRHPFVVVMLMLEKRHLELLSQYNLSPQQLNGFLAQHRIALAKKFTNYLPDADQSLRLSYGRIKGYYPADGVYYTPVTHLGGLLAKSRTGRPKYSFAPADNVRVNQSLPVCLMYDTDTVGGTSGSPVFNAEGNVVAINFDRTFLATINDFYWHPEYSRSVGTDIRAVLWVLKDIYPQPQLLNEIARSQKF